MLCMCLLESTLGALENQNTGCNEKMVGIPMVCGPEFYPLY